MNFATALNNLFLIIFGLVELVLRLVSVLLTLGIILAIDPEALEVQLWRKIR